MSRQPKHPTLEQLDQLRAGLLDDRPQERDRLRVHLEACPSCQARHEPWQHLSKHLQQRTEPSTSARYQLQLARYRAVGRGVNFWPRWASPLTLAVAASLLVAVTLSLTLELGETQPPRGWSQSKLADDPDLYANVDFYLWLASHNGAPVSSNDDR